MSYCAMMDAEICRQRSDELLKLAAATEHFGERSRLISEATFWHMRAEDASSFEEMTPDPLPEDEA